MSRARKFRRLMAAHPSLALTHIPHERRDYYAVHFETIDDYPHNDRLLAIVRARRAEAWADVQEYIDGDTWDSCGSRRHPEVYAIVYNLRHVGGREAGLSLIERLRGDGYRLDLTNHEDFEPDCGACDCEDPDCPYRVHLLNTKGERFCGNYACESADAETDDAEAATCPTCKRMCGEQLVLPGVVTKPVAGAA